MKKAFLFLVLVLSLSLGATAQTKAVQTVKISLPTINCDMCKARIETYLKRYDGIAVVNVNVKRKEAAIKFYTDRVNEEDIKAAIANTGYDANEVTAEPEAYKRLPICCKKPEDGGPKKKN